MMLISTLTKRLCPLMSLALAFGCGKKINEPKTSSGNNNTNHTEELPSNFSLQINETVSSQKSYQLIRNGWFFLPNKLYAQNASASGKQVKIWYNVESDGDYEYSCLYKSTGSATELGFVNCEDSFGSVIISNVTDLQSMDYPMDKDKQIKMKLLNPSSTGIKIEAIFQVDWK